MSLAVAWVKLAGRIDWVAVSGVIVAIVSVAASIALSRSSQRQAAASAADARRSADASERSADASERSAEAAGRSAGAAEDLTRIESDHSHERMAPTFEALEFKWERHDRTQRDNLFCYVTNGSPRGYQVTGWLINEGGGRSMVSPFTLQSGRTEKIHIGTDGMTIPKDLALAFDRTDCPCGGRRAEGDGHWVRTIAVEPPRRARVVVMT